MKIFARTVLCGFLTIALHSTPSLANSVTLLSASRNVSVSASATGSGMTATDSKSTPSNQFGAFDSTLNASAQEPGLFGGDNIADSSASQQSNITDTLFSLSQSVFAESGGALGDPGPGAAVNGNANSLFQVSFSVSEPVILNLSGERSFSPTNGDYFEQASLNSQHHGDTTFLSFPPGPTSTFLDFSFDELLVPGDVYFLTISQTVDVHDLDPLGAEFRSDLTLSASFTPVPDAGTSFALFALSLAPLVWYRQRFAAPRSLLHCKTASTV